VNYAKFHSSVSSEYHGCVVYRGCIGGVGLVCSMLYVTLLY
jgi:hypothetical protein